MRIKITKNPQNTISPSSGLIFPNEPTLATQKVTRGQLGDLCLGLKRIPAGGAGYDEFTLPFTGSTEKLRFFNYCWTGLSESPESSAEIPNYGLAIKGIDANYLVDNEYAGKDLILNKSDYSEGYHLVTYEDYIKGVN